MVSGCDETNKDLNVSGTSRIVRSSILKLSTTDVHNERLITATCSTEQPSPARSTAILHLHSTILRGGPAASSTADYTESIETTTTTFVNLNHRAYLLNCFSTSTMIKICLIDDDNDRNDKELRQIMRVCQGIRRPSSKSQKSRVVTSMTYRHIESFHLIVHVREVPYRLSGNH